MPEYRFTALDGSGGRVSGGSSAASLADLTAVLKGQGLFLIRGQEEAHREAAPAGREPRRLARTTDPVPLEAVALFMTQLSIMVRTALPIPEALEVLGKQQKDEVFRSILQDALREVRHGRPLSDSFARFPKAFDEIVTSLLAVGEAGGKMEAMLERIAAYLEFQREIRAKVKSAMMYPSIVIGTAIVVVLFIVLFILPTFAQVFGQFEMRLPLPTRVLLGASGHLRSWWLVYLTAALVGGEKLRSWVRDPAHRRAVHQAALDLPGLGTLSRNLALTRVLRTLTALLEAGVPILKSLQLARAAAGNALFEDMLGRMGRFAAEGRGLAPAIEHNPYMPEAVVHMVANAERTGTLPEVLSKVADYYEKETDRAIKDLFTLMEPLFIVLIGTMVGGIAVSVLLPMFQLGGAVQ